MLNYKVLKVKKALIGKLNPEDPFFDSLKADYPGFENWLQKKANEYCYVSFEDKTLFLEAFLYLKLEDINELYLDIDPILPSKLRLKVGTFKVTQNGSRLGERFLKIIFDNALEHNVEEIYVTIYQNTEEQKALIALLEKWGFQFWGIKGGEIVLVKSFNSSSLTDNLCKSYPFVRKKSFFINPIWPEFHTDLFPDSILKTESTINFVEDNPHRNGISKVYLSRSWDRSIVKGDLVVMYRTGGIHKGVATTLCVVEEDPLYPQSFNELLDMCGNRSVFDESGLLEWWNYNPKNRPFVVKMLYLISFPKRPNLSSLIENKVITDVNSVPRGFSPLTNEQFQTILNLSEADARFIVN